MFPRWVTKIWIMQENIDKFYAVGTVIFYPNPSLKIKDWQPQLLKWLLADSSHPNR